MSEFVPNERYKELRPAGVYAVAANETWLEDMARQGYFLVDMTGWEGVFEQAEPRECRYRMSPMRKKEKRPRPELLEAYAELGWHYAASLRGTFHIWRCDDPAVPELDTDPVVQAEGYRHLEKRLRRQRLWDILWSLALLGFCFWAVFVLDTPGSYLLHAIRELAPGRILLGTAVVLLGLVLLFQDRRARLRLLRTLAEGIPLARPAPYGRQKWLARVLVGLSVCLFLLMILGDGRSITGDSLATGWDIRLEDGALPKKVVYVDLARLETAEGTPQLFQAETKVHELAPRMYVVWQYMDLPDGTQASVESAYYRLWTPGMAKAVAEELTAARPGSLGVSPHGELLAAQAPELDGFWWVRSDVGVQTVVALLGREVLEVRYEGPADLRDRGAVFAAVLKAD